MGYFEAKPHASEIRPDAGQAAGQMVRRINRDGTRSTPDDSRTSRTAGILRALEINLGRVSSGLFPNSGGSRTSRTADILRALELTWVGSFLTRPRPHGESTGTDGGDRGLGEPRWSLFNPKARQTP